MDSNNIRLIQHFFPIAVSEASTPPTPPLAWSTRAVGKYEAGYKNTVNQS